MQPSAAAFGRTARAAASGPWTAPRIAVGGIAHETNTFSSVPTALDDFRRHSYLSHDDLVRRNRRAWNVLGGAVAEADARGVLLLPTLVASAMPSGLVDRSAWDLLRTRLLDRRRAHQRGPCSLDDVPLVLHGAMVPSGEDDPEGMLLAARGLMASGGPMPMGRTALLAVGGVAVVVCERPIPAVDPALVRSVRIEPAACRVIAVKSSVHVRAAFAPLAADVIEVETPGLSRSDPSALPDRRVRRPIAPLDPLVRYLD